MKKLDIIVTTLLAMEVDTDKDVKLYTDIAKREIKTLMLELVGEDRPHESEHSSAVTKAELRKKIEDL